MGRQAWFPGRNFRRGLLLCATVWLLGCALLAGNSRAASGQLWVSYTVEAPEDGLSFTCGGMGQPSADIMGNLRIDFSTETLSEHGEDGEALWSIPVPAGSVFIQGLQGGTHCQTLHHDMAAQRTVICERGERGEPLWEEWIDNRFLWTSRPALRGRPSPMLLTNLDGSCLVSSAAGQLMLVDGLMPDAPRRMLQCEPDSIKLLGPQQLCCISDGHLLLLDARLNPLRSWEPPAGIAGYGRCGELMLATDGSGGYWVLDSALRELQHFRDEFRDPQQLGVQRVGERFVVSLSSWRDSSFRDEMRVNDAAGKELWNLSGCSAGFTDACSGEGIQSDNHYGEQWLDSLEGDSTEQVKLLSHAGGIAIVDEQFNLRWSGRLDGISDHFSLVGSDPQTETLYIADSYGQLCALGWDGVVSWLDMAAVAGTACHADGLLLWRTWGGSAKLESAGRIQELVLPDCDYCSLQLLDGTALIHCFSSLSGAAPAFGSLSVQDILGRQNGLVLYRHQILDMQGRVLHDGRMQTTSWISAVEQRSDGRAFLKFPGNNANSRMTLPAGLLVHFNSMNPALLDPDFFAGVSVNVAYQ
ncbi:hypothetical protein KDL44_11785 [bacterium]|nr:hypothetical protein [bacterium]